MKRRHTGGPDRLRDLARIAGDLGADEMVHDAIAFVERTDLTSETIDAAIERYADRLIFELDERRAALMRPPALTGSHAAELGAAIASAQLWLKELAQHATAEQESLMTRLNTERQRFLDRFDLAASRLRGDIQQAVAGRWQLRRWALHRASEIAATRVKDWFADVSSRAESMQADAIRRYATATQQLVERIRAAGVKIEDDGGAVSVAAPALPTMGLEPEVPFGWRSIIGSSDREAVLAEASAQLREAMEKGSAQIVSAFHEALLLARRRFEWEIALRLRAIGDSLDRASAAARSAQAEGAQGIANELNRLDELGRRVAVLVGR
ncbi:MAG: hypothetical protein ACXVIJ_03580 [Thermoanaerobaculia bacterium]